MKAIQVLFLSEQDIASLITPPEVLDVVEEVFRMHGENNVLCPQKLRLDLRNHEIDGWINAMPTYLPAYGIAGMKWINVHYDNERYDLPHTMGLIILNEPETGSPLAFMDGSWITHVRTGAATAVAAKYLANPAAETIVIIGAGAQGRTNLEMLMLVRRPARVYVADINPEATRRFVAEFRGKTSADLIPAEDLPRVVAEGNIVVVCTNAKQPVLMEPWVKPGTFICDLGGCMDVDKQLIYKCDKYVLDDIECAMSKRGLARRDQVYGELGRIVAGAKPGWEAPEERIFFAPVGMGSEDIAVAYRVYQRAVKHGIGKILQVANEGV
jgi:alanine dehydrogenase